jgi:hypothetical protein
MIAFTPAAYAFQAPTVVLQTQPLLHYLRSRF